MSVNLGGCKIRSNKSVIFCSFLRGGLLFAILVVAAVTLFAGGGDASEQNNSSSSVSALPCYVKKVSMVTPVHQQAAPIRTQRAAGSPSLSPAMALALALGVKTVQGPMVHTKQPVKEKYLPSISSGRQDLPMVRASCASARCPLPSLPVLAMER